MDPPPFENFPLAFALFGLYKVYAWLSAVGLRPPLIAVWLPLLPFIDPLPVKFPIFIDPFIVVFAKLPILFPVLFVIDFFRAWDGYEVELNWLLAPPADVE